MRLQHGFSLVEVLITLLIIKIGLLGILAAQTLALRQVQDAIQRTKAVAFSSGLLSELQANQRLAALIGPQFNLQTELPAATECTAQTNCNTDQLAAWQLNRLQHDLQVALGANLADPVLCLQQDATTFQLQLSWQQRAATARVAESCNAVAGRSAFTVQGVGGW
jgi:type IV pilus assembly protein PilV